MPKPALNNIPCLFVYYNPEIEYIESASLVDQANIVFPTRSAVDNTEKGT